MSSLFRYLGLTLGLALLVASVGVHMEFEGVARAAKAPAPGSLSPLLELTMKSLDLGPNPRPSELADGVWARCLAIGALGLTMLLGSLAALLSQPPATTEPPKPPGSQDADA
jgi:hypothetical protein